MQALSDVAPGSNCLAGLLTRELDEDDYLRLKHPPHPAGELRATKVRPKHGAGGAAQPAPPFSPSATYIQPFGAWAIPLGFTSPVATTWAASNCANPTLTVA